MRRVFFVLLVPIVAYLAMSYSGHEKRDLKEEEATKKARSDRKAHLPRAFSTGR